MLMCAYSETIDLGKRISILFKYQNHGSLENDDTANDGTGK